MNGRPRGDHKLVFDTHALDLAADSAASRVDRKCLNIRLGFGWGLLHGAQQPLVALARRTRQNLVRRLEFLLGLLLLQEVDVEPPFLHIVDDGSPGERHTGSIAQARKRAVIGGEEDEAVAAIARLRAVVANARKSGLERSP